MAKAPSKLAGGFVKKKKKFARPGAGEGGGNSLGIKKPGSHRKIGQILIDTGLISEEQLWSILEHHKTAGTRTGESAVELQMVTAEDVQRALAEQQGMTLVTLLDDTHVIPQTAVDLVPETMCQLYKLVPYALVGNSLTVAVADPANLAALDDVRNMLSVDDVQAVAAPLVEIEATIERLYAGKSESLKDIINQINSDVEINKIGVGRTGSIDLDSMMEIAEASPVRKLLNMVLLLAIRDKASDIHFEPFEDEFKMRYRADGVMFELVPPPRHLAPAIASRI
ncbi:MAG: GspE/PulE family protein, partial [Planctomycetia bacterium]